MISRRRFLVGAGAAVVATQIPVPFEEVAPFVEKIAPVQKGLWRIVSITSNRMYLNDVKLENIADPTFSVDLTVRPDVGFHLGDVVSIGLPELPEADVLYSSTRYTEFHDI